MPLGRRIIPSQPIRTLHVDLQPDIGTDYDKAGDYLPTTEPATPQAQWTIGSGNLPIFNGLQPFSYQLQPLISWMIWSEDTAGRSYSFRIKVNGVSKFYYTAEYAYNGQYNAQVIQLMPVTVVCQSGDTIELYLWCPASSLLRFSHAWMMIRPCNIKVVPGHNAGAVWNRSENADYTILTFTGSANGEIRGGTIHSVYGTNTYWLRDPQPYIYNTNPAFWPGNCLIGYADDFVLSTYGFIQGYGYGDQSATVRYAFGAKGNLHTATFRLLPQV